MDKLDAIGKTVEGGIKTLFALPGILVAALGVMVALGSLLDLDFFGFIVGMVFMGLGLGWISWTLNSITRLKGT